MGEKGTCLHWTQPAPIGFLSDFVCVLVSLAANYILFMSFATGAHSSSLSLSLSLLGHPVSEGDTDTEPLTPETETGQPISERDTDTTTRLSDTHVLESPCGSDGPTRRLRSKSVNTAKEKRQLTLLESVSTSVSSGTSNTHKQPTLK